MAVSQEKLEQKLKKLSGLSPEEQAKAVKELFTAEELNFLRQQASVGAPTQRCVFCGIAAGEIPAKVVYDDAHFLAFLDINPANPGHLLVVPKQHYAVLPQLPDELTGAYMKLLKILSAAVFEATDAQGINVIQNNGAIAGQAVPHIHFHIIPRFENDGIKIAWDAKKVTDKQLENIQARIVGAAQAIATGKPVQKTKTKAKAKPKPKKKVAKKKLRKVKIKRRKP